MLQTIIPLVIATAGTIIAIVPIRMKLSNYIQSKTVTSDEHEEEVETEFDYILMLSIPFIALLFGEAFLVCGFVPLTLICIALRLYAKPNLSKERAQFLRLLVGWLAPFGRKLGFGLMGIMLGLHVQHND